MFNNSKIEQVKTESLKPNHLNPRIDLDVSHIYDSIKEDGIRNPLLVGKSGEIYRGHLRHSVATQLGISTVPAIVIADDKFTEAEKLELLIDHSSEKPLSKAEAYLACREFFRLGYGQTAVFKKCKNILNVAFGAPQPEKITKARAEAEVSHEDADEAEFKACYSKHRGTIQHMDRLASLPDVVGEEYIRVWTGDSRAITSKDVKDLAKLFDEAFQASPETVNRDNAPKDFYTELEARMVENAKSSDEKKSERSKMQAKDDIVRMIRAIKSSQAKLALQWVLGEVAREAFIKKVDK